MSNPKSVYLTGDLSEAKEAVCDGWLKTSSESKVADMIRSQAGFGPEEPIQVTLPQTERDDSHVVADAPSPGYLSRLKSAHPRHLKDIGMRSWNAPDDEESHLFDGGVLWLFPGEWYDAIPEGFEVTSIMGDTKPFSREHMDRDTRFGMLSFGIVQK